MDFQGSNSSRSLVKSEISSVPSFSGAQSQAPSTPKLANRKRLTAGTSLNHASIY